jgi:hypothetical protein
MQLYPITKIKKVQLKALLYQTQSASFMTVSVSFTSACSYKEQKYIENSRSKILNLTKQIEFFHVLTTTSQDGSKLQPEASEAFIWVANILC